MSGAQTSCRCCGTCCRKGGPVLHKLDLPLIQSGYIKRSNIVLLRPGEPVNDNITGKIKFLSVEMFKLRGKSESNWTCTFLDPETNLCRIYSRRPRECRLLKCWDTKEIEAEYGKNLLSLKDILTEDSGMRELVDFHRSQCPLGKAIDLVKRATDKTPGDRQALHDLIAFDKRFREQFALRTAGGLEVTDFYFGRPLEKIIPQLRRSLQLLA